MLKTSSTLRDHTFALFDLIEEEGNKTQSQESLDEAGVLRSSPNVLEAQQQLASQLAGLRGQNRRLAHVVRDTKAKTGNSRAEVDRLHLSLQNLYYEQRHLLGEIDSCENYAHPFEELPLIDEAQFMQRYPDWQERRASESTTDEAGEQGLMKARIAEEKKERLELEGRRLELVKRKVELVKETAKRKEELGKLDRDLEAFIDVRRK